MTTRPQLASSPAIAVFTSGELAIDIAIRRADSSDTAPVTSTSTNLVAPSPSRTTCNARSSSTPSTALAERVETRVGGRLYRRDVGGAGREEEQRVGGRCVAVDCDRVEAAANAGRQDLLQHRRRDRRVRRHEGKHRRHIRRDHAGPLGDAVDADFDVVDLRRRGCALGEGVGRHDRARRRFPAFRPRIAHHVADDGGEPFGRQRLTDDTGGCEQNIFRLATQRLRHRLGGEAASPRARGGR